MLNLTPHAITVGSTIIEPSGTLARVSMTEEVTHLVVLGVPVITRKAGSVTGIPEVGGEQFLVSSMVLDALGSEYAGQAFAPDTGSTAIRNEKGHIVSVTQLVTK